MQLIQLDSVDSTNRFAQTLIAENRASDRTVVLALEQTSGRGQRGKSWVSKPLDGLYATFIFTPAKMEANEQFLFNKAFTCGVVNYIERQTGFAPQIKWPNDVLIDDHKVAGILIENQLRGMQICAIGAGVGINLNQDAFSTVFETLATSLKIHTGLNYNPVEEVKVLFEEVDKMLKRLENGDYEAIRENYREHLFMRGKQGRYVDESGDFEAVLEDVDDQGNALLLRDGLLVKATHPLVRFSMI